MKVLDLFCGAGGAAMGLHQAWPDAEIIGVDTNPKLARHYPFTFVCADAMTYPLEGAHFIWASPPCQGYSVATPTRAKVNHPLLIPAIRERLRESGAFHVIENVSGARAHLERPLMLCGTMFGLRVFRHRFFELLPNDLWLTSPCAHNIVPELPTKAGSNSRKSSHRPNTRAVPVYGGGQTGVPKSAAAAAAMGIDWMTLDELSQAIPPAYSRFIAEQLTPALRQDAA